MKSSVNLWFFDDFSGNRSSLTCLNLRSTWIPRKITLEKNNPAGLYAKYQKENLEAIQFQLRFNSYKYFVIAKTSINCSTLDIIR